MKLEELKMKELKTLKDKVQELSMNEDYDVHYSVEEVFNEFKIEAIKWIKAFGVAEPFSKKLDAERQFIRKISIEGKNPHAVAQEVIKHIFNITDSELSK